MAHLGRTSGRPRRLLSGAKLTLVVSRRGIADFDRVGFAPGFFGAPQTEGGFLFRSIWS
jgi:hypothetical protein